MKIDKVNARYTQRDLKPVFPVELFFWSAFLPSMKLLLLVNMLIKRIKLQTKLISLLEPLHHVFNVRKGRDVLQLLQKKGCCWWTQLSHIKWFFMWKSHDRQMPLLFVQIPTFGQRLAQRSEF